VNAQNTAGNTGMHYLHAYGHSDLAEYVRQKGADDTILNANELTCYEGLNLADVDSL
jgi:ankyrin repeat protein